MSKDVMRQTNAQDLFNSPIEMH